VEQISHSKDGDSPNTDSKASMTARRQQLQDRPTATVSCPNESDGSRTDQVPSRRAAECLAAECQAAECQADECQADECMQPRGYATDRRGNREATFEATKRKGTTEATERRSEGGRSAVEGRAAREAERRQRGEETDRKGNR
jgi:hypothetical protein